MIDAEFLERANRLWAEANEWLAQGRHRDALPLLQQLTRMVPDDAAVMFTLGLCFYELGDFMAAASSLSRAILVDPQDRKTANMLARSYVMLARTYAEYPSLPEFRSDRFWIEFARNLGPLRVRGTDANLLKMVEECLEKPGIEAPRIARIALDLLSRDADIAELLADAGAASLLDEGHAVEFIRRPIFNSLLTRDLICNAAFERFLTRLRRDLLCAVEASEPLEHWAFVAACTLALQCQNNEFMFWSSDEEFRAAQRLASRLETILTGSSGVLGLRELSVLAVCACYRPLHSVPGIERLASRLPNDLPAEFKLLHERQVTEPLEEKALAASVAALTPIEDSVSRDVARQYNENPYPRWFDAAETDPIAPGKQFAQMFPGIVLPPSFTGNPEILVAGCGSGRQAVMLARRHPQSPIFAVDISRTNLAHAIRRARALGIGTIDFAQADILELGRIGRQFPLVECTGVLHHMKDPMAGWRVLSELTEPGGIQHIALYSALGRRDLDIGRNMIECAGYSPNARDISRFRQDVFALPDDHPLKLMLLRNREFYATSSCRDLLFHVQEHRFTFPQIRDALSKFGLRFLGFRMRTGAARTKYRDMFPHEPTMTNLDNWHRLEEDHPMTFVGMYIFYCQKAG